MTLPSSFCMAPEFPASPRLAVLCFSPAAMQNEEGKVIDLYLPRKCSATNRLIAAKEHGSMQLNVGQVDEAGRYTGEFYTFAIAGFIHSRGEGDACLNRLLHEKGLLTFAK